MDFLNYTCMNPELFSSFVLLPGPVALSVLSILLSAHFPDFFSLNLNFFKR